MTVVYSWKRMAATVMTRRTSPCRSRSPGSPGHCSPSFELPAIELEDVHATVVTDCTALGGCIYRHVAYIFFYHGDMPDLIVAAETNEPEATAAAEHGAKLLYYLGLFTRDERRNLGYVAGLDDLDRFVDTVGTLVTQIGGLPPDAERTWLPSDERLAEIQAELINAPGGPSRARLSAQLQLINHTLSGVDQKLPYDGCRNAVKLAVGIGDLDTALAASRTALAIDMRSAVTRRTGKYDIASVDPLRHRHSVDPLRHRQLFHLWKPAR